MPSLRITPFTKEIELPETNGIKATFRQATQDDMVALGDLFSDTINEWDQPDEGTGKIVRLRSIRKFNFEMVKRARVYRTLIGCNLEVEETGGQWFTFKDGKRFMEPGSEKEFNEAFGRLDPVVAEKFYAASCQVNPQFLAAG